MNHKKMKLVKVSNFITATKFRYKCPNDDESIDDNPFLITIEKLKKITLNYDSSRFYVSSMNDWQKYKNRYSRALMQAKRICKQFGK